MQGGGSFGEKVRSRDDDARDEHVLAAAHPDRILRPRRRDLAGPVAIKEAEGTNTSLGGFIEVARKAGAEFTVPMAASPPIPRAS